MTITRSRRQQPCLAVVPKWLAICGSATPSIKAFRCMKKHHVTLPNEIIVHSLSYLDGISLLACGCVCVSWDRMTQQRSVWKNICITKWPTLRHQILPQLPGALDYDIIRLYGGCWKRCFTQGNRMGQRAELSIEINPLSKNGEERIVSDTFVIGDHHFCLWIFPQGNPHEAEYAGRVLSVYLVITDLQERAEGWGTCAVFTLSVKNHIDPSASLEWNSSLADNKFDKALFNWGVHSLGRLDTLLERSNGYLKDDRLTVSVQVRLMSITFRVILQDDMKKHHGFGIADLDAAFSMELPFCCTLNDLISSVKNKLRCKADDIRIWCFNQPVTNGKALRPRKLIWGKKTAADVPMFADILTDGVDIDAYSVCQIYVENLVEDEHPLGVISPSTPYGYIFVKLLDPTKHVLKYVGRAVLSPHLSIADLYAYVSLKCGFPPDELRMYREEILPIKMSGYMPPCCQPIAARTNACQLFDGDIVIFEHALSSVRLATILEQCLDNLYTEAKQLLTRRVGMISLEDVETISQKLDIPKFRVRSAFRKCNEDPRRALEYIMEGRHLGFICDTCGETDFRGIRHNCNVCNDYDLCSKCYAEGEEVVSHRYANIEGKWQKQFNFTEHTFNHPMKAILPVFCNME